MTAFEQVAHGCEIARGDSLQVLRGCKLEAALENAQPGQRFQFVRTGYFTPDSKNPGVFNRIVTLKDSFAKTMEAARG